MEKAKLKEAYNDLAEGLHKWPMWSYFAWNDIKQKYRRSIIGPLWITLSLGVTIVAMGGLFGTLFGQPMREFLPYMAVGMILWSFIQTTITEATMLLPLNEGIIRQIKMPYSMHMMRLVWRNLLLMAHNAVVVVLIFVIFGMMPHWHALFLPLFLLMVIINCLAAAFVIAMICVRFRDVAQIVVVVLQIVFFLTPIVWKKESLSRFQWILDLNPLTHMLNIIRAPLMGMAVPMLSLYVVTGCMVVASLIAFLFFAWKRRMISLWV